MGDRYGFVILNYGTMDETIECVRSIGKHVKEEHEIVIIDNASPDGSGDALRQLYSDISNIKVIVNEGNLGYACGNNVGIARARQDGCSYVVVLNSDTRLMQDEFCEIVRREYNKKKYAVIGPEIYKQGQASNDNPGRDRAMSNRKLHVFILMNRILLALSYISLDAAFNRIFNAYVESKKSDIHIKDNVENVALHGCCLVFTPVYFEWFRGFDNRTYMYMEEDVLYHHLLKAGLVSAYVPQLHIEHLEEAATNKVFSGVKKRRFKYKNYIKSSKVMLAIDKERT